MSNPILLSGIQPSGRLHIGNYLGMLQHAVELQNSGKYHCYYFLADLHSLTEYPANAKEQQARVLELAADMLAIGLDPKKSILFQQSQVPAHSELMWILSTVTPVGDLERMTQFKDKAATQRDNINAGLLYYPVLMAADILLYGAKFVPVGDDQDQHLELARAIARKFNNRFGETFAEPKALYTKTPRIMSLKDPLKKMSKSQPDTCLFMDDTPNEIERKIKTATTDSGSEVRYDMTNKPGIANLMEIYEGLSGDAFEKIEREFKGKNYGEFKARLIGLVIDHFAGFRKKKKLLLAKPAHLRQTLRHGSMLADKVAGKKIAAVKKAVGIAL